MKANKLRRHGHSLDDAATTMRHARGGVFVVMAQHFVFTKHIIESDEQKLRFYFCFFCVASRRRTFHRLTLNSG